MNNGAIKVGTQKEVDFATKQKHYLAKIGLPYRIRRGEVFISWRFLKSKHDTQSEATKYGDAFLERYKALLLAMEDEPEKKNWFIDKVKGLLH